MSLKTASQKASKILLRHGPSRPENLTAEQYRENLVKQWEELRRQIDAYPKKSAMRKSIGREMHALQMVINGIRPKRKLRGVEGHFVDAAREFLPKATFTIIMNKAAERCRAELREESGEDL